MVKDARGTIKPEDIGHKKSQTASIKSTPAKTVGKAIGGERTGTSGAKIPKDAFKDHR